MELCIVVPTFNEAQNVVILVEKLTATLQGIDWEVIFVDDDSSDGTADIVRTVARDNPHVRCLQRIGRRGLSSAVIEGMLTDGLIVVSDVDIIRLVHSHSLGEVTDATRATS